MSLTLKARERKLRRYVVVLMAAALAATPGTSAFCITPPSAVNGQTLSLGGIELMVPEGSWYRADPESEATEEAAIFYYRGVDEPGDEAMPKYVVRIEDTVDVFSSGKELEAFYKRVEINLSSAGWKQGNVPIQGRQRVCYVKASGGTETTFLVQLPFGVKSVTAYVVVPRAGAGFPKSAIPFLEGIRVQ